MKGPREDAHVKEKKINDKETEDKDGHKISQVGEIGDEGRTKAQLGDEGLDLNNWLQNRLKEIQQPEYCPAQRWCKIFLQVLGLIHE